MMRSKTYIGRISIGSLALLIAILFPIIAYCGDKLIVRDADQNTKFVVTDEGKVGLGTADPEYTLDARGSIANIISEQFPIPRGLLSLQHSDINAGAMLTFERSRGSNSSPVSVQTNDFGGFFGNIFYDGTSYRRSGGAGFVVDGPVSTNVVPSRIGFYTSQTSNDGASGYGPERLTIKSNGYIGIGTTNPAYPLHMASGARCTTGGVWQDASSREYKQNIRNLSIEEAVSAVSRLNPVKFNYKTDVEERHVGFIAEDVPALVASKDRRGLSPMDIVAVLTRVVQEQQEKIHILSEKLDAVEKQIRQR
jgi:hypothetical protein